MAWCLINEAQGQLYLYLNCGASLSETLESVCDSETHIVLSVVSDSSDAYTSPDFNFSWSKIVLILYTWSCPSSMPCVYSGINVIQMQLCKDSHKLILRHSNLWRRTEFEDV
jgi:hypothetical protein